MTTGAPFPQTAPPLKGPEIDDVAFVCLTGLAHREAGLHIPAGKAAMVRTRLSRRLRALNLRDFDAYCALLQGPEGREELGRMISALTTNVSHFFREEHHFEILKEKLLPGLIQETRRNGRIRIWSAGCSNGQEPYSIAMTLQDAGLPPDADVRILATDIDPNVVAHARRGQYPDRMTSGLPTDARDRFFTRARNVEEPAWQANADLADLIVFRELNLLRDWPMRGQFDAIFCRNVLIYFDAETQDQLWPRFAAALKPGGWLFLGHSERISERGLSGFESRGMTSYQRVALEHGASVSGSDQ